MTLADLLGLGGAALIVGAYALLQAGRLHSGDPGYSLANALGAAAILLSLASDFNLGAFVVEAFWLLISLYGLARALRPPRGA